MTEQDLPPDIYSAVLAIRDEFADEHLRFNRPTKVLCYDSIRNMESQTHNACRALLSAYCDDDHELCHQFLNLTPAWEDARSFFRNYLDLYIEAMVVCARRLFARLVKIGRRHKASLQQEPIAWAKAQMKGVIQSYRHLIPLWVRAVCDGPVLDTQQDSNAPVNTQPWQAPAFLDPNPAPIDWDDPNRFDPARKWRLMDAAISAELLEGYANDYVQRLQHEVEKEARAAYIEVAEHGLPDESKKDQTTGKGPALEDQGEDSKAKEWEPLLKLKDDPDASWPIDEVASLLGVVDKTIRNRINDKRRKLRKHPNPGRVYVQTAIQLKEQPPPKRKKSTRQKVRASRKAGSPRQQSAAGSPPIPSGTDEEHPPKRSR